LQSETVLARETWFIGRPVVTEFKRILCAVDFSEFSRRALDHALSVARGYGSTVTALHVVAPAPTAAAGAYFGSEMAPPLLVPSMDRETASRELERLVTAEHVPGVMVETVVAEAAETYRGILTQAVQLQSDLLVMGTHGRSGFERLFLGSTAEKVLRKAGCPVMTVPPKAPDAMPRGPVPFSRIVCGVDFSASSRRALDYATSLAQQNAASLAVLHVIDIHPLYVDFAPPAAIDLEAWTHEATGRLRGLVPDGVRAACSVAELVREGAPYQEILRLSHELGADLIVLGVRGRRAADLLLFGSTTHHVVREAQCAVLTLRS
jgi:nucleotide-binding universal stress UspA family protein